MDRKNYRSISLLPLKSGVENSTWTNYGVSWQINILYKFQSGFRKNHSTDFCLSYLIDKISKGFDSGLLTGMILTDLQKTFNVIDHNILLLKMPSLSSHVKLLIVISHTYLIGNSMLMFMTNSLPLRIYDAEVQKDPFLDLCYFCCI